MEDPTTPNPYRTLNVPKDATLATIRSAHRKLVLSCHPDKVQDESAKKVKAEQFHQVQQAYEILSDDKQRQRYDERVKLDELRAEMASDRGPSLSRRATDFEYGPRRSGPPPRREMRDNTIFETVEPRNSRYSDEDYPAPKYGSRPSSKSYDDYYSYRRTSGRAQEEKRKARDIEDERERERDHRRREREEMAFAREQRTKKRDKDKRRNTESKSKSKTAYVDSASDSELDDRYYTSKRESPVRPRFEDLPMRSRENPRKNARPERGYDDELDAKLQFHQEHINKSREPVEIEPRHSGLGRNRATSNIDPRPPPPPPVDSAIRSSVRRGHSSRQVSPVRPSKKDKRSPEIVDPPSNRKSSLPNATSESKSTKKSFWSSSPRREPHRSSTHQPAQDFKPPSIRRSETMPMQRPDPLKSSTLRNMKAPSDTESSDSDSEMTEDIPTHTRPNPRHTTRSYRVRDDEDSLVAEPQDSYFPKTRETSPRMRRSGDRPTAVRNSAPRTPQMPRPSVLAFQENDRSPRPGLSRTESARPTPTKSHQSSRNERPLFGAVKEDDYLRRSPDSYGEENSRYKKQYGRRGSEDVGRDDYPGSKFRPRPGMERSGTYAF